MDEIRARVEAADKARIQARSDAAAKIAADVERRAKVRAELAEIDAVIAADLAESATFMTLAELSAFTGIPVTELSPPVVNSGGGGRRPARRKAKGVGTRKVRLPAPDSASTVAVSSDF